MKGKTSKSAFRNLRTAAGVAAELILAAGEEVTHGVYQEEFGFLLASVLVILLSLSGSQEIMAQNAGLILHLPFDEGSGDEANDDSPTGLNGTII